MKTNNTRNVGFNKNERSALQDETARVVIR